MRKAWPLLLITTLILFPGRGFVFSQDAKKAVSSIEETLYKGEMKSIRANVPSRVIIGKPEVADILTVSTKEIVVVGKGAGSTNLIWWDERGEHLAQLRVLAEDMGYINTRINNLIKELSLPDVSTQPSDSEGKVLLLGSVKSEEDVERIRTALGGLFAKTTNLIRVEEEKAIIELEVEVIEVDKGATREMGMDWLGSGGKLLLTEPGQFGKTLADVPESLFKISEWTHPTLLATLNLMVSEGKARILSRPKLACQSGKEAQLLVGAEQPIMTTQVVSSGSGGSSTSVEYKEYGIKLKMSPTLNRDGKIKLALNVEVSDIGETAEKLGSAAVTTAVAYPFTKRTTSTEIYLNNNQTLAISGLIQQKTTEELKKFPWLGDVPILGVFFRSRTIKHGGGSIGKGDSELVILVTPSVLEDKSKNKKEPEEKNDPFSPAGQNSEVSAKAAARQSRQGGPASSGMAALPINPAEGYTQQINEYLRNNISYPWTAKQAQIEGTVVINLHLAKSGDLLESNVGDSSGYSVLDEHTIGIARQITPYPSFPRDISEQDLWVQIPIVYNLKQKK